MFGAGTGVVVRGAALVALVVLSPVRAGALQLDGRFGRWTVGGYAEGYAVIPTDSDSSRQRPAGILDVAVTGDVHPKARFYLDLRTTFGGTPEHADGFGFMNLRDTFQNISPFMEIEETYVDLFLPSVDVRVGKQKIAWGKLDTFQPTDIINPRRYNDPFVIDREEQKIGVPAVRASYYLPQLPPRLPQDASFTLVWVPLAVQPRFPLEDERWFPSSTSVPPSTFVPRGTLTLPGGSPSPSLLTSNALETANVDPTWRFDNGAVGLRLAGLLGRADWALYYYNGPETFPAFDTDTVVFTPDPSGFTRCALQNLGHCRLKTNTTLQPTFGRVQLAGGDVAVALGGLTARFEGAYGVDRLLPRSTRDLVSDDNLGQAFGTNPAEQTRKIQRLIDGARVPIELGDLFVARDTVEWGLGVDYRWRGFTPVLQVLQTFVLDNDLELLVPNVATRLFGVVRKAFLDDRLQTEVGLLYQIERAYTSGIARFTYSITDHWRARLGYVLIAGSGNTLVGQFHDNDELFLQLRYSY